jgi:hypothetical protein
MIKTLSELDLRQFTGSENWYRHSVIRDVLFTDGVKYVSDKASADWLIDEIAFAQKDQATVAAEAFQVWKLDVLIPGEEAILTCEDGNGQEVFTKPIDFAHFPEPGIELWFTNNTILLPSEY